MLEKAIEICEELKKYIFIIDRGEKGNIIIKFKNENFYHLLGLQHTNIDMFIPDKIKGYANKYKHIKKNINKFSDILKNQISKNEMIYDRINNFNKILDILKGNNANLYNLSEKLNTSSLYDGDYCLSKIYNGESEKILHCILGLKEIEHIKPNILCVPQSFMTSRKLNSLIENRKILYYKDISNTPIELYVE